MSIFDTFLLNLNLSEMITQETNLLPGRHDVINVAFPTFPIWRSRKLLYMSSRGRDEKASQTIHSYILQLALRLIVTPFPVHIPGNPVKSERLWGLRAIYPQSFFRVYVGDK